MSHNTTHIISYHTHHLVFPKIHIILLLLPFPSDFSPLLSSVFPPFSGIFVNNNGLLFIFLCLFFCLFLPMSFWRVLQFFLFGVWWWDFWSWAFSVDWSRGQRLGLYLLLAFLGVLNFLVYVCGQMGLSSLSPPPSKKGGRLMWLTSTRGERLGLFSWFLFPKLDSI